MGDLEQTADEWLREYGAVPSQFRLRASRILASSKPLSKKLNALEAAHKQCRNDEVEMMLSRSPTNTRLSRLLHKEK